MDYFAFHLCALHIFLRIKSKVQLNWAFLSFFKKKKELQESQDQHQFRFPELQSTAETGEFKSYCRIDNILLILTEQIK